MGSFPTLIVDQPAGEHRLSYVLNSGAYLAGIQKELWAHDLRRGGAAEMFRLPAGGGARQHY